MKSLRDDFFILRKENRRSESLIFKDISPLNTNILSFKKRLLLLNSNKPRSLLTNLVLSKSILPSIMWVLIFPLWKILLFEFELINTEEFTLILLLNNNPDLINSTKIGFISNILDIV